MQCGIYGYVLFRFPVCVGVCISTIFQRFCNGIQVQTYIDILHRLSTITAATDTTTPAASLTTNLATNLLTRQPRPVARAAAVRERRRGEHITLQGDAALRTG